MRFQNLIFLIILIISVALIGCTKTETPTNVTNARTAANANVAVVTEEALATTKKPEAATSNNAPMLASVVRNYYEALRKKDDAALRKVYSQATLKSLETDMKEEKKTSLVEYITELEPVPDKPFEVRNEEVQGDTAFAEMRGGSYPNGIKIKFVKENGEWKMTNESPEVQPVRQSAVTNSNLPK